MKWIYTTLALSVIGLATDLYAAAQAETMPQSTQQSAQRETPEQPRQVATGLLRHKPIVGRMPVFSDSTDRRGQTFDLRTLTAATGVPDPSLGRYDVVRAGTDGFVRIDRLDTKQSAQTQTQFYGLYLLPDTYTKGRISVETNVPWELFVGGRSVARGLAVPDSVATKPIFTDITLNPHLETAIVRLDLSADELAGRELRIKMGFTPTREGDRVRLLTEERYYPDLGYMIWGETLSGVAVSPSGRYTIVYKREYQKIESATTRAYLYEGGRQVMELTGYLSSASWMPKSDRLYYESKDISSSRKIYVWSPATGETQELASQLPEGYLMVSPTERSLIIYQEDKGAEYKKTLDRFDDPRERTGGYRDRTFLGLYDLESASYQPLTFGSRSTYLQDLSADGKKLIFSVSTPTPTVSPFSKTDFYEIDLETFAVDTLFADTRGIGQVYYTSKPGQLVVKGSADAFDYIGCVLPKGSDINTYDTQLFLYDQTKREARALSKELDRTIGTVKVSRGSYEAYFTANDGDLMPLYRIDLASGKITRLSTKEGYVKGFSIAQDGSKVSYVGQGSMSSDRCYILDMRRGKGKEELLYDLAATKNKKLDLGTVHDWDWKAPDGTTIQGRYYLPAGFDPNKKYPMLVYYYGGTSPVSRTFEGAYSLPMFAAQGYVVYSLNPSGSTGYGQEFAARHINAWGQRTADEIIGAVKDFTAQHSFVNAERIGCMGASYGGFMTQYLQTQTDLFAAACSHAGISSISSYWGEGYWGVGYSTVASKDSYPWNNPRLYTEHSPLFLADKINTPLLLIHGLSDTNVPVGESWQMFNALKILGKPVEFVGVYGEDHHILDPQKRYEWSSAIMAFFAKYLQDNPTWWNDLFPGD